jgi:hypothetical protein
MIVSSFDIAQALQAHVVQLLLADLHTMFAAVLDGIQKQTPNKTNQ